MRSLLFLALVAPAVSVHGQPFTRITDLTNPIVTEARSSGGSVWADFDNDGDLDLFVANGNQNDENNSLFLNEGGGRFTAVGSGPLVSDGGSSIGGTAGDFDGDGRLDLFVTNRARANNVPTLNFLYRGGPGGVFTRVTDGPVGTDVSDGNTASWVDADADGDLDLFVTNFSQANFFYRNDGGSLVRASIDLLTTLVSLSITGTWADYDGDGDGDYFMGNGGTQNDMFFRNGGGLAFTLVNFTDERASLGSSWADYDHDGDLDLFVANFLDQDNLFYRNSGPPNFDLVALDASPLTTDGGRSVGTAWGDYDNDGDLDLFVANTGQANFLYENSGPPNYTFSAVQSDGVTSDGGSSFGAAWADYDHDGDLDLFVANQSGEPNFLYRNDRTGGHWLTIDLRGKAPNTAGIGARVTVRARIGGTERVQVREMPAQTGYNSQTLRLHLGLGEAASADAVHVHWPDGTTDVVSNVAADGLLTITQGQRTATQTGVARPPLRLDPVAPNPSRGPATLRFTLATTSYVRLAVFDILGREVAVLTDGVQHAGPHEVTFTGRGLPPGLYMARLTTPHARAAQPLLIVR